MSDPSAPVVPPAVTTTGQTGALPPLPDSAYAPDSVPLDVAIVVHADRLDDTLWFYDCPACPCAFGLLRFDRKQAEQDARQHDSEYHRGVS